LALTSSARFAAVGCLPAGRAWRALFAHEAFLLPVAGCFTIARIWPKSGQAVLIHIRRDEDFGPPSLAPLLLTRAFRRGKVEWRVRHRFLARCRCLGENELEAASY
jgi:hypothetical protein